MDADFTSYLRTEGRLRGRILCLLLTLLTIGLGIWAAKIFSTESSTDGEREAVVFLLLLHGFPLAILLLMLLCALKFDLVLEFLG